MGNRAIITTRENFRTNGIGIYLHWNGGRDSVNAFLRYCKLKRYRSPEADSYGWLRLCQVIGNFFGGGLSAGIENIDFTKNPHTDNGVYIIEDWEIVDRKYFSGLEQDNYKLSEFLEEIDETMPVGEQLGKDFFNSKEVEVSLLEIGDEVLIFDEVRCKYEKCKVVGFGDGRVNGLDRTDKPYVDRYGTDPKQNCNNYIMGDYVKKICEG